MVMVAEQRLSRVIHNATSVCIYTFTHSQKVSTMTRRLAACFDQRDIWYLFPDHFQEDPKEVKSIVAKELYDNIHITH
jgi:hypothetical protein